MNVTFKKLKIYNGMSEETVAFNADVYIDGVKVGDASNRGHGDPVQVNWTDGDARDKFRAWVKTKTYTNDLFDPPKEFTYDEDYFFGEMVDDEFNKRERVKWIKKSVIFRLKGDNKRAWQQVGYKGVRKLSDEQRIELTADLRKEYGDQIEEMDGDMGGKEEEETVAVPVGPPTTDEFSGLEEYLK